MPQGDPFDMDEVDNEENLEEIDFDQLLGDAAQSQADYDEDREDQDFDDEEEECKTIDKGRKPMQDTFSLSKTDITGVGVNAGSSTPSTIVPKAESEKVSRGITDFF